MAALRVAVVEDNPQLRDELARLVSSADDMTVVGPFASGEAALAGLGPAKADVVLMDIQLPGMSGIECVRRLCERAPGLQVVMLTAFDDGYSVFESLKAGATGYVLKRAPSAQILEAVREVAQGGAPMTGAIARKVVQFFGRQAPAPELSTLTERERDVLVALSRGQQYKEVAAELEISINTVRKHVRGLYDKLHVSSRLEAVRKLGGP
jgi:DNA-binding NarL/FixJ family response regulator